MTLSRISRSLVKACNVIAVGIDIDHSFSRNGEYDNVFGSPMRPLSYEELRDYVKMTDLPFVVKGVLSVTDAVKCLDAGVSGIIVSHHHGIIPYAVPPLMVLPEIAKRVNGRMRSLRTVVFQTAAMYLRRWHSVQMPPA